MHSLHGGPSNSLESTGDPSGSGVNQQPAFGGVGDAASSSGCFPAALPEATVSVQKQEPDSHQSQNQFQATLADLHMNAPTLALEPPTPREHSFHPVRLPSPCQVSGLQTQPNITHVSTFKNRDKKSSNDSPPTETFHSSPQSPQSTLFGSPGFSNGSPSPFHSLKFESSLENNPDFQVQISLSKRKGRSRSPAASQKRARHQRDASENTSATCFSTACRGDIAPALDPRVLEPPLFKVLNGLTNAPAAPRPIVSPFINHTMEPGPDGTVTVKYQRPLTSTGRPSHARKTPPGHVKRPRNAFILFRSHACASNLIPAAVEKDHRQISRIVSFMWRNLPAEERLKWEKEAEAEKELHRKLHPDYRYKPIYRKVNTSKKKEGEDYLTSPPTQEAPQNKKKGSPVNEPEESSEALRSCSAPAKTFADLQQEREEAIRCKAVAQVVMELRHANITLSDSQLEDRVKQEVLSMRREDAMAFQLRTSGSHMPDFYEPVTLRDTAPEPSKPTSVVLPSLPATAFQPRRKSQLNRANSAPPPPSPLREMHPRDMMYNPRTRRSRELSPDFPRPKVTAPDDGTQVFQSSFDCNFLSQEAINLNTLPAFTMPYDYSRFTDPTIQQKPLTTYDYNANHAQESAQELDQLFESSDFAFGDNNSFGSGSAYSNPTNTPVDSSSRFHPTMEELFEHQLTSEHESLALRAQLENYTLAGNLTSPIRKLSNARVMLIENANFPELDALNFDNGCQNSVLYCGGNYFNQTNDTQAKECGSGMDAFLLQ